MKLVFATNNRFKFEEARNTLGNIFSLISLSELGFRDDIPETHKTIEENAEEKASVIYRRFGIDCFADDTALEIDALHGEPGVYSARYAGPGCTFDDNMNKVLSLMDGINNRRARFRTITALIETGSLHLFEGRIEGEILTEKFGDYGFGYDPIFLPAGYTVSFAQMDLEQKNRISHRSIAMNKLATYLKNKYTRQ